MKAVEQGGVEFFKSDGLRLRSQSDLDGGHGLIYGRRCLCLPRVPGLFGHRRQVHQNSRRRQVAAGELDRSDACGCRCAARVKSRSKSRQRLNNGLGAVGIFRRCIWTLASWGYRALGTLPLSTRAFMVARYCSGSLWYLIKRRSSVAEMHTSPPSR